MKKESNTVKTKYLLIDRWHHVYKAMFWGQSERFVPRSHFIWRWNVVITVNVVLKWIGLLLTGTDVYKSCGVVTFTTIFVIMTIFLQSRWRQFSIIFLPEYNPWSFKKLPNFHLLCLFITKWNTVFYLHVFTVLQITAT